MFKKISINTIVVSVGKVVGVFASWVTLGLITHTLGKESFGDYSTIFAYLLTLQAFADFGLHTVLTRELSKHTEQEQKNKIFREFLGVRLILVMVVLAIGLCAIFLFPYDSHIKIGVVLASLSVVLMSIPQIFLGVFQSNITSYKYSVAELAGRLTHLGIVAVLVFVFAATSFLLFVGAFVGSLFIFFVFALFLVRKEITLSIALPPKQLKPILRSTLPIGIAIFFSVMYFRSDTIMLSLLQDSEAVGLYSVGYKIFEALLFFPAMLFGLFLPALSRSVQKARRELGSEMSFLVNLALVVVLPLVVCGVLFSASIIQVIGGSEFLPATTTLQILFGSLGIIVFGALFGNAIIAMNAQREALWAYGAGFVFNIIANLIVIPRYSYEGAAYTTLATEIIVTGILAYIVYRRARFTVWLRVGVVSVLAAFVMGYSMFSLIHPVSIPVALLSMMGVAGLGLALYVGVVSVLLPSFYAKYSVFAESWK